MIGALMLFPSLKDMVPVFILIFSINSSPFGNCIDQFNARILTDKQIDPGSFLFEKWHCRLDFTYGVGSTPC